MICHALMLPAPLHNPKTVCGIEMSAAGIAAGHAEDTEILGVRGPDNRITCALCKVMLGTWTQPKQHEWDDERVPTIQELSADHGVAVTLPVDNARVIVAAYLDMLRTAKAENFLLMTWSIDFGGDEKFDELRRQHPNTEWDAIEVVTYARKKSTPDPATLAADRLRRITELEAELRAANATDGGWALIVARATAFDALQALDEIAAATGWQLPEKPAHGFDCTQGHSIAEDIPARWWMGEGDAVECCCVACMPKQVAKAWAEIEGTADAMMREASALNETKSLGAHVHTGLAIQLTAEQIKANHDSIDGALAALAAHRDEARVEVARLRRLAPVDPLVQDPATTIRVVREQLAAANEKTLEAMRREKVALDQVESMRCALNAKDIVIKQLNDAIVELSE